MKRTFNVSRPIHTNQKRKHNETFSNYTVLQELPPNNRRRVKRRRPNSQNKEMAVALPVKMKSGGVEASDDGRSYADVVRGKE